MWEYVVIGAVVVIIIIILCLWLTSSSSTKQETSTGEIEIMGDYSDMEEYSRDYCYALHHLLLCRRRGEDVSRLKSALASLSEKMNKVLGRYYIVGDQYGNLIKEKAEITDRQMMSFMSCTHIGKGDSCYALGEEHSDLNSKLVGLIANNKIESEKELLKAYSGFDAAVAESIIDVNYDKFEASLEHLNDSLNCLGMVNAILFEHLSKRRAA